jgi:hypothetical protein
MTTALDPIDATTTAQDAAGATSDGPAMVGYPQFLRAAAIDKTKAKCGCGNAGPMEITKRFPQDLGNLAQNARFPHSHKPFFFLMAHEKNVE